MTKVYRLIFSDEDHADEDRQTTSLAGLAVTLLIVVACLFVLKELRHKAMIEDCLLSGRYNCDAVVAMLNSPTYPR